MWQRGWRDRVWAGLDQEWDIIIIGGGITGAGILREAVRAGQRALLVVTESTQPEIECFGWIQPQYLVGGLRRY